MNDPLGWWSRWGYCVVWAAGGVVLLARYRRHPRASRRGLAGVAVALGLLAPLHAWANELVAAAGPRPWAGLAFGAASAGLHTLSCLLVAWAVVADRSRPADDV